MDTSCLSKIENMLKVPNFRNTPVEIERQRPTVQHQMDNLKESNTLQQRI